MSKSDDIPQDVWDKAGKVVGAPNVYVGRLSHHILHERCARGILAERERAVRAAYIPLQPYVDAIQAGDAPEAVTFLIIKDIQRAIRHPQEPT